MIYICITPFFPSPGNWRGAYVLDQVKAIQRNSDYEVVVFRPAKKNDEYVIDGITVHCFKAYEMPSYLFNGLLNPINAHCIRKAIKRVFSKKEITNIKIAHCHTGPFAVYGLALKKIAPHIKVFVQHHNLDTYTIRNGKFARWKPNAIYRAKNSLRLINAVDLNICISTPCKQDLIDFPEARPAEVYQSYLDALKPVQGLPKANPKDIYVLFNGVDTTLFSPSPLGEGRGEAPFRIGCIANFQELKDHITLIKAFEIFLNKVSSVEERVSSNIRLSLLGSGETKAEIEKYLKETIITSEAINPLTSEAINPLTLYNFVEWPSEVTHDKLPDYYRSLDLFVLPSFFEGFGCVYTEAHACGVPFMGVYDQGAAEVIAPEERDKWLIKPHDHEQLARLMERYYHERYEQKLCQPIDIDTIIKNYLDYIEKL